MFVHIPRDEIEWVANDAQNSVSKEDRAEMAIPSYLHKNRLIRWLMWRRYHTILKLAQFQKDKTALEFGCGLGIFLPTLSAHCSRVMAIDLFPVYAQRLVERRGLNVEFCNSIEEIKEGSLDYIVAADVMEHLESPLGWAQTFHSKLKQGGNLIISGPTENIFYRLGRRYADVVSGGGDFTGHYHHSNIDDLHHLIQSAGFTLTKKADLPFAIPPHLFRVLCYRS